MGIWGSPQDTEQLYNNIKRSLRPHAQRLENQLPFDVPPLPEAGEIRYLAKHYYNNGIKSTFHFIDMLPCYTGQLVNKAKISIEDIARTPSKSK